MRIRILVRSSVHHSHRVHSKVVHPVNEWIGSFQNCELVQFVQLKDSFNWTSSWTTDPSLLHNTYDLYRIKQDKFWWKCLILLSCNQNCYLGTLLAKECTVSKMVWIESTVRTTELHYLVSNLFTDSTDPDFD